MKYLVALILALVLVAHLAEAKRQKKGNGKFKGAGKMALKTCVTWSTCTEGQTTTSWSPDKPECNDQPEMKAELDNKVWNCTETKTFVKKNCTITVSNDLTACSQPDGKISFTKTGCGKDKSGQKPCFLVLKSSMRQNKRKNKAGKPKKNGKGRKNGRGQKGGQGKKMKTECKYSMNKWSPCDPLTNKKTMVRSLKRGDPAQCNRTQTMEKPCKRKTRSTSCKYKRVDWSECDGTTNIKTMARPLKRGDPKVCAPFQVKEKICKRKHKGLKGIKACKYRKKGNFGACDLVNNIKTMEMTLKKGDPKTCALTKTVTKPCKKKSKTGGCKYDKSPWGPCDAASNTVSRTWSLRASDNRTACNITKLETRKCKDKHLRPHVCKYRRTTWGECDTQTNTRQMVKTLKRGDSAHCTATSTIEKKCKKTKPASEVCKYRFETWTGCDPATNTMTRRQVLKSGPNSCQKVKEYSKKCKRVCRFVNGDWSECDPVTNQMTRTDTLVSSSGRSCPPTRTLSKKCGKKQKKCLYEYGDWTACDESDIRTRVQKIVSGGNNCEQEKITTKSCHKKNGNVRCFFGPWSDYEPCKNGVQKKQRQVLQGGVECELKGVKMKPCEK